MFLARQQGNINVVEAELLPVDLTASMATVDERFYSTTERASNNLSQGKMEDYFGNLIYGLCSTENLSES
jgi:hypothetical protein